MERKSAWSLLMSEQQIVNEYKEAKSPRNQIAILADQNMCDKKTIVNILEAAGCEVPGYYKKKTKDPEATAEVFDEIAEETQKLQQEPVEEEPKEEPKQEEEPLPIAVHVRLAALSAIGNMLPDDGDIEELDCRAFVERTIGILQLVKEVEHGTY